MHELDETFPFLTLPFDGLHTTIVGEIDLTLRGSLHMNQIALCWRRWDCCCSGANSRGSAMAGRYPEISTQPSQVPTTVLDLLSCRAKGQSARSSTHCWVLNVPDLVATDTVPMIRERFLRMADSSQLLSRDHLRMRLVIICRLRTTPYAHGRLNMNEMLPPIPESPHHGLIVSPEKPMDAPPTAITLRLDIGGKMPSWLFRMKPQPTRPFSRHYILPTIPPASTVSSPRARSHINHSPRVSGTHHRRLSGPTTFVSLHLHHSNSLLCAQNMQVLSTAKCWTRRVRVLFSLSSARSLEDGLCQGGIR